MSALILHQKDGRSSFQSSLPLSSSVLTPVKSLSHQVRQIAFQRLLPAAKRESRAGQAAAGSWGRQQVPNTCGSLEFPSTGTGQPAVGRGLFSALALDGAGGTLPCISGILGQEGSWMWGAAGAPGMEGAASAKPFGAAGEWVTLGCMNKTGLHGVKVAESAPLCCHPILSLTLACSLQHRVHGTDGKHAGEVVADGEGRNSTVLSVADKGWWTHEWEKLMWCSTAPYLQWLFRHVSVLCTYLNTHSQTCLWIPSTFCHWW